MSNSASPNMNFRLSTSKVGDPKEKKIGGSKRGLRAFFSRKKKKESDSLDNIGFSSTVGSLNKPIKPYDIVQSLSRTDNSADFRLQVVESVGRSSTPTIPKKSTAPLPPPMIQSFSKTDHQISALPLNQLDDEKNEIFLKNLQPHQETSEAKFCDEDSLDGVITSNSNDNSLFILNQLEEVLMNHEQESDSEVRVSHLIEPINSDESLQQMESDSRCYSANSKFAVFVAPPPPNTPPSSDIPMAPPPWAIYADRNSSSLILDLEDKNVGVSSPDFETARKGNNVFLLHDNVETEQCEEKCNDERHSRPASYVESSSSEMCTVEQLHADLDEMITMADEHLTSEDMNYNIEVSQFVKRMQEMTYAYHNMQEVHASENTTELNYQEQNDHETSSRQSTKDDRSSIFKFEDDVSEEIIQLHSKRKNDHETNSGQSIKDDRSSMFKFEDDEKYNEKNSTESIGGDSSSSFHFHDDTAEKIIRRKENKQKEEHRANLDLNMLISTKDEFDGAMIHLRNAPYYNENCYEIESISSGQTQEIEDSIKKPLGFDDHDYFLLVQIEELEEQLEILRNQLHRNQELLIISRLNQIKSISASNCVFHQQIILQRQMIEQLEKNLAILRSQLIAPTEPTLVYSDDKMSTTTFSQSQARPSPQSPVMLRSSRGHVLNNVKNKFLQQYKENFAKKELPDCADELRHASSDKDWSKTSKLLLSLSKNYENESPYFFAHNVQVNRLSSPLFDGKLAEATYKSKQPIDAEKFKLNSNPHHKTDYEPVFNYSFINSIKENWRSLLKQRSDADEEFELSTELSGKDSSMKSDVFCTNYTPSTSSGRHSSTFQPKQQSKYDETSYLLTIKNDEVNLSKCNASSRCDSWSSNQLDQSLAQLNQFDIRPLSMPHLSSDVSFSNAYEQLPTPQISSKTSVSSRRDSISSQKQDRICLQNCTLLSIPQHLSDDEAISSNQLYPYGCKSSNELRSSDKMSAKEPLQAVSHLNNAPQHFYSSLPPQFDEKVANFLPTDEDSKRTFSDHNLQSFTTSSMTEHWTTIAPNISLTQNVTSHQDNISTKSCRSDESNLSNSDCLNQINITISETFPMKREELPSIVSKTNFNQHTSRRNSSNQSDSTRLRAPCLSEITATSAREIQSIEKDLVSSTKLSDFNSQMSKPETKNLDWSKSAHSNRKSINKIHIPNDENLPISKENNDSDASNLNLKVEEALLRFSQYNAATLSNQVSLKSSRRPSRHSLSSSPNQYAKKFEEVLAIKQSEHNESITARWSWSNQVKEKNSASLSIRPTRHSDVGIVNTNLTSDKHFRWSQSSRRSASERSTPTLNKYTNGLSNNAFSKTLPRQSKSAMLSNEFVNTTAPSIEDDLPKIGTVSHLKAVFSGSRLETDIDKRYHASNEQSLTLTVRSTSEPPFNMDKNVSTEQHVFH